MKVKLLKIRIKFRLIIQSKLKLHNLFSKHMYTLRTYYLHMCAQYATGIIYTYICSLTSLSTNFSYRIPTLWNSFTNVSNIRCLSLCGLKTFRRSLKRFLMHMQNAGDAESWFPINNDLVTYCTFLHSQSHELTSNQPRLSH